MKQLYTIWVNGYSYETKDHHFPIDSNLKMPREWTDDFESIYEEYKHTVGYQEYDKEGNDCFDRAVITLFVVQLNVEKFESEWDLDFDLDDDDVQDCIADAVDYDFTIVCEKEHDLPVLIPYTQN